ncbi:MAG: indolepyruvate oxidoreductase subunit beta [Bacteroidia bacterium]|jgi:Pyruvate:ferredoxin oxidoreductase and related 2-oxoacid:ferredoxin oxidoreductases, gamma subunit|nr:indolepyruvate oxidoreductase subunit beta [Bacteroidia bacterium]
MKTDIILAGVGGQGILSVAAIVGHAAVAEGLYLKQAETHGMSQRGGDVQSHLRIASDPIASDLIPMGKADLILSGEPMESLRYLPFLSPTGYLVTSTDPLVNIPNYPPMEEVMGKIDAYPRHVAIDADTIAKQAGSARAANVVMLGAASPFIMTKFESLEAGIVALFSRKGADVVEANLKALRAGREQAVQMGLAK